MKPSTKNQNQRTVTLMDFSGGLNTAASDEMIAANQCSELVNMEIGKSGHLRTSYGTVDVTQEIEDLTSDISSAAWDDINKVLLLFCKDGNVYVVEGGSVYKIGELSGNEEVITVNWEDGILVASGGYLQYGKFEKRTGTGLGTDTKVYALTTIFTSPKYCGGVYVRSGRVFIFDNEDNLRYSAIGDETDWTADSNDDSAAIFTQIGYKVGGRIIGLVNFQSYILIIKDNGKIFRLDNEYPDWVIKEVTSSGLCKGRYAYASVGSNVFVLGENTLQAISPTDDYGNMPVNYVGKQVSNEISALPFFVKLRFNPDLNQLWFVTRSQWVLIYDCNTQTFFQRYFNSDVVDMVGNFIIKRNKVSQLACVEDSMKDDGVALEYRAKFKTEVSMKDLLVRHIDLSVLPLVSFCQGAAAMLMVGKIKVPFPDRLSAFVDGARKRTTGVNGTSIDPAYSNIDGVWNETEEKWDVDNSADVFLNMENLAHGKSLHIKKRQVYRNHEIEIALKGSGFPFVLNFLAYDIAEV